MQDKKRIVLNISTGIIFKIILILFTILNTRFVLINLGKDINGLLALFTSIIGFLSIVELGIGNAITYSMYKPIVEKDYDKVSALYHLYKKMYRIVMVLIVVIGGAITFLVPTLAKDYTSVYNIKLTYLLFLASIVGTYLFAHKTSTINAFKDNYITTLTFSLGKVLESMIQILVLILTKNFIYFLLVRIIIVLIEYLATNIIFKNKYQDYLTSNKEIEVNEKNAVIRNIKALFMINLGAVLILSTDNIIISAFIGVESLGQYNLYSTIISAMAGTLSLVFIEITSILGHKNVEMPVKQRIELFKKAHSINFILGIVFFLGFFSIANVLIEMLYGKGNDYSVLIIGIITLTFFTDFMRKAIATFKNSLGLFHQERFRPIIEGFSNIILSLILVRFLGLVGVLAATIISRLLVLYTIEPFVVFKHGFEESPKKYYLLQYLTIVLLIISFVIMEVFKVSFDSNLVTFIVNGFISVGLSLVIITIVYLTIKPFRVSVNELLKSLKRKRKVEIDE